MRQILRFLGLSFDPDLDGLPPIGTVQDRTVRGQEKRIPDNVVFTSSQRAAFQVDEESLDWDRWSKDARTPDLTDRDREVMSQVTKWRPSEDKYRTIKGRWALGLSIQETSDRLTAELGRGWKKSTIDKYYSLINKASGLSPTSTDRGGLPKTTQTETTFLQLVKY